MYKEVMETKRPSGNPKPAFSIDEWLSWGKGGSFRVGQARGHVERHFQKESKGKKRGATTFWVGRGQASRARSVHQFQPAPARRPSPPLSEPPYGNMHNT